MAAEKAILCVLFEEFLYIYISRATRVRCLHSKPSIYRRRIPVSRLIQKSVRILRHGDNLQNGATLTRRRCYGA